MKIEYSGGHVLIIRQFAAPEECAELSLWAESAVEEGQFVLGLDRYSRVRTRLTNRMTYAEGGTISYPPLVYTLRARIAATLGLTDFGPIEGHGRDGVVCSITYDGGDVYEHTDPPVRPGFCGLRCNLLSQAPTTGGTIRVSGSAYELLAGDLQCYRVTECAHSVDKCGGQARIMFMFGWAVPK